MKTFIKSNLFFYFSLIVLIAVVVSGCSRKKADKSNSNEPVYVSVNGVELTESGLRAIVPKNFYDKLTPEHRKKIVDEWVNNELLYQEALKRGIDKEPDIETLLLNTKRTLLSNELIEREMTNIKPPSDNELKKFYEDNKSDFEVQTKEFKVRFALFDNTKDAAAFHDDIKKNQSFSDLAKQLSKDPSSKNGGDIGIIDEDNVEPDIWGAVNKTVNKYGLKKISDPFMVSNGWGCVIVDESFEPGSIKPFENVKDLVYDLYMQEKRDSAQKEFIKNLSGKAQIKYVIK
jgi:peptidyl-prolyl cis-trans isomerase C